ncbi:hypothetical protein D3C79_966570 [compost metagenome]
MDHRRFIDVGRQRQLHQDAVHGDVGVQLRDQLQHLRLTGVFRQTVLQRADANLPGPQQLVAHIHLTGRVSTHQQHGQGGENLLSGQDLNLFSNLVENQGRDGFAIDIAGRCGGGVEQNSHRCLD